jgi:hypothetical protein
MTFPGETMPSHDNSETSSDPEVLAARGEVLLAKAELESRLHQASDSGRRALGRLARKARPVLIAAAVVVGLVVIVRVARSASRKRRARRIAGNEIAPSLFKVALGAALRGAVRVLATRAAEQAVARLAVEQEEREPAIPAESAEWPDDAGAEGFAPGVSSAASR